MTNEIEYIDLISKHFAGEASNEEMKLLLSWLKADAANQKVFDDYKNTWELVESEKINNQISIDAEWEKLNSKLFMSADEKETTKIYKLNTERKSASQWVYRALRIAAVFTLLAGFSYLIYHYYSYEPKQKQVFAQTENLENKLPDGTSVVLHKGSTLEYPEEFKGNNRSVKLTGEAYFDVAHDKTKPFIISAEDLRIEVLGTSFYVNSNAGNGKMEVVLTTGKLAVFYKDKPNNKVILNPGDKAEVSKAEKTITKVVNEDQNYMAWKTKKMVFFDDRLGDIIQILNKVYNSNIQLKSENLADCRITATFDNQSLDAVLNVLKATVDFTINKKSSVIEISGNGCK